MIRLKLNLLLSLKKPPQSLPQEVHSQLNSYQQHSQVCQNWIMIQLKLNLLLSLKKPPQSLPQEVQFQLNMFLQHHLLQVFPVRIMTPPKQNL
ncbi:unnamed protein product [Ambrosiozyma monospora]|uniref:Unnamed protein product n=1 Tax=Ambrosiozyma monospora TaxID=43982 RepID=A0ACB5U7D3_AMBMO|nr:unnamed protein product [Ambrosiozyma monospora]